MTFQISKNIWTALSSLLVAVVLLWAIFGGFNNGRQLAQSELILTNADSIIQGLKYFYNDQNRFPSALEFLNGNIMNNYFNIFPPVNLASRVCVENFVYKRIASDKYELNFCLPTATNDYSKGWNIISNYENDRK